MVKLLPNSKRKSDCKSSDTHLTNANAVVLDELVCHLYKKKQYKT